MMLCKEERKKKIKKKKKKTGINPHTEPYITLKKRWEKWYANIVINNTIRIEEINVRMGHALIELENTKFNKYKIQLCGKLT